jgi:hypothetical protein
MLTAAEPLHNTHNPEAKFHLRLRENPAKEKRGVRAVHVCNLRAECESGDIRKMYGRRKSVAANPVTP